MVVGLLAAGAMLAPLADADQTTQVATLPGGRMYSGAALAGGFVYVVGGLTASGAVADNLRFNPSTHAFTTLTPMPLALYLSGVTSHGGNIWVIGGTNNGGTATVVTYKYAPSTDTWTLYYNVQGGQLTAAAAVSDGTYIYVLGGDRDGPLSDEIRKYDPANPTAPSSVIAHLPTPREYGSAVFDGRYVWYFAGRGSTLLDDIVRFDPSTAQVTTVAHLPETRWASSAVWDGYRAFIFDGVRPGTTWTTSIFEFTPSTGVVQSSSSLPSPSRCCHPSIWVGNRAYLFGGQGSSGFLDQTLKFLPSPLAPLNLAAARGPGVGQIALTWQAPPGTAADSYKLYRGTTSGSETYLTTTSSTSFTDSGLPRGARFYYKVTALNEGQESPQSGEATATAPDFPGAPTSLQAARGDARGRIHLTWSAPSDNGGIAVTSYNIYRSLLPGAEVLVAQGVTSTTYDDNGLADATRYYYQVSAVNPVGEGGRSGESSAVTPARPSVPQFVATSRGPGAHEITVVWNAPADDGGLAVTSYTVERSASAGGPWSTVATVGPVGTWTDTALPDGAVRFYRVTAANPVGPGPTSPAAQGTAPTLPSAPASLAASTGPTPGTIKLSWTPPEDSGGLNVTKYVLYRTSVVGGPVVAVYQGLLTSFQDVQRLPGVRYYYNVTAVTPVGAGPSTAASARGGIIGSGSTVPLVDPYDEDGDFVPTAVESQACGTAFIVNFLNNDGIPGECQTPTDYEPLHDVDDDDDLLQDANVEPFLCTLQSDNNPADGACVGDDYGWPN